jgi:hypothetical protein
LDKETDNKKTGDGTCLTCKKQSIYWECDSCQKKRIREKIKKHLIMIFEPILIISIITLVWQGDVKITIGEMQPDLFDAFIAIILTFTIVVIRRQAEKIKRQQTEIDKFYETAKEFKKIATQIQYQYKE